MNHSLVKNELIFAYAAGKLGYSKSIFTATYLYLNSRALIIHDSFEKMLGDNLLDYEGKKLSQLKYSDCLSNTSSRNKVIKSPENSPINKIVGPLKDIKWKKIFNGFNEFVPISKFEENDKDELKLIKMDPGASVPLHSHEGKEYILVLDGSFCDEYGNYNKGDIQINDQKIRHTPIACKDDGCICLTITEKDVIFFGKYGSLLNLYTFIRSFFK